MITLITGAPGAGKTALVVELLRTVYADRPIYVHGLNGLTLPHQPVDAAQWHSELPDGALLVVDEVQQVWRPRGPGHAPSSSVQALETHRHRGIDVILTTQKPNLVDANVRGLVGRHLHIRDTGWRGRWLYEWPECSENLAWKTCHLKSKYKLPRKAFDLYKSASVHTTAVKGRSLMPLITAGLILAFALLAFMVYRAINRYTSPPAPSEPAKVTEPAPLRSQAQVPAIVPVVAATAPMVFPVYRATPIDEPPDPYDGRGLQIDGHWTVGAHPFAFFGVFVQGERVASVTLDHLLKLGYTWLEVGPCAGVLRYRQVQRVVSCGKPSSIHQERERPGIVAAPGPAAS